MGLGPLGTSLLERVGKALVVIDDESESFQMAIEQQNRSEARQIARMRYLAKHKAPVKPLAPVEAEPKVKGVCRMWRWVGEPIESKGLVKYGVYSGEFIRKAGFKLPKLQKKAEKTLIHEAIEDSNDYPF